MLREMADNYGVEERPLVDRLSLYAYRLAEVALYFLVWLGTALVCYLPALGVAMALVFMGLSDGNLESSMFLVSGLVASLIGVVASFFVYVLCRPWSFFGETHI